MSERKTWFRKITDWIKRKPTVGQATVERIAEYMAVEPTGRVNPAVRCPRCSVRTVGALFQVGPVRLCEPCAKSLRVIDCADRAGWKIRKVRAA